MTYNYQEDPTGTIAADGTVQHFSRGAEIAADWWRLFNCPKLDAVVMESIANNPSLQAAQASLRQSQDNLRAGYGIFFPQISAGFQPTRQQFSPARFGENIETSIFSLYTLSTTATYVLDVFGGERRTVESLGAQVDVQYYTAEGTYLTLSGNVVNAIVAEAAYEAEIDATQQIIGFLRGADQHHGGASRSWCRSLLQSTQHSERAGNDSSNDAASSPAIGAHTAPARDVGRRGVGRLGAAASHFC